MGSLQLSGGPATEAPSPGQQACVQRNLERAGDLVKIDVGRGAAQRFHFSDEPEPALVDDVAVPAGLHECHSLAHGATVGRPPVLVMVLLSNR